MWFTAHSRYNVPGRVNTLEALSFPSDSLLEGPYRCMATFYHGQCILIKSPRDIPAKADGTTPQYGKGRLHLPVRIRAENMPNRGLSKRASKES